jgi:hypothetical protein
MQSDVVDRLTGQARRALQAAQRAAVENQRDYVGTEHLLWSLLAEAETGAATLLDACGIDIDGMRGRLRQVFELDEPALDLGHLPATPAVKRVLAAAAALADEFHHPGVGTEHLLLGLAAEENGVAGELLGQSGASLRRLREQLARMPVGENRDLAVQTVERPGAAPLRADPSVNEVRRLFDVPAAGSDSIVVADGPTPDIRAGAPQPSADAADDLAVLRAFGCLPQLAIGLLLGTLAGALWGTWVMLLCMAGGLVIGASRSGYVGSLGGAFAGYHLAKRLCGDEIEALFVILACIFAGSCVGDWPRRLLPPARNVDKPEDAS